jgi:hypothetical protein
VSELSGGSDADRAGGTLRDQQRSQSFDVAGPALGLTACPAREHRACRFDRVELVRLPVPATRLSIRAIDLNDRQP